MPELVEWDGLQNRLNDAYSHVGSNPTPSAKYEID